MVDPLVECLEHYCSIKSPGFAILVSGPWGVGKTYQVKSFFEGKEHCYVSLYGVATEAEVHSAVFMEMEPRKAKTRKTTSDLKNANISALGFSVPVGAIAAAIADQMIIGRVNPSKTIVFDDLERCNLDTKVIQGIIDRYLQRHDCRVVLIAHDLKLQKELLAEKEKLIGQTVRVVPNLSAALRHFLEQRQGNEREFLLERSEEIKTIFQESGVESLRILKQMMNDLVRLFHCLSERHLEASDFLRVFLRLFLALSSEVRSGRLKRADIVDRGNAFFRDAAKKFSGKKEDESQKPNRTVIAINRFKSVNLTDAPIEDYLFVEMLFDGIFDKDRIQSALDRNPRFAGPERGLPWRSLMEWDSLSEVDADAAIRALHKAFSDRKLGNIGDIFHSFALELMLSNVGIDSRKTERIVVDYKGYLDDLLSRNEFPRAVNLHAYSHGYGGFGYWVTEESRDCFNKFSSIVAEYNTRAWENAAPSIGFELLKSLESGVDEFRKSIIPPAIFDQVPVLPSIDVSAFVSHVLKVQPGEWWNLAALLQERWERAKRDKTFEREVPWFEQVVVHLTTVAVDSTPIRRAKINRMIWRMRRS